jgi:hypothetical protein
LQQLLLIKKSLVGCRQSSPLLSAKPAISSPETQRMLYHPQAMQLIEDKVLFVLSDTLSGRMDISALRWRA